MPRGAEYAGEPPQSDNAIENGKDIIHGGDGKVCDLTRSGAGRYSH